MQKICGFLCEFLNFVITSIQQYFLRFVINKISFTAEEHNSKHLYRPYIELQKYEITLASFFQYSFYNKQYKDQIKSCVLLHFMY